jgi:hypothetical protein
MQLQSAALQATAAAIDATDRVASGIGTSLMKSGLLKKNVAKTCMRMTAQEARASIRASVSEL